MRLAEKKDIDKLALVRVSQQKDDWKENYENKNDLAIATKKYLEKHLNKDLFAYIEEIDGNIVATCCIQIIEYLPQCNDNGKKGYICNVFTEEKYRKQGIQTKLLNETINYAIKNNLCELSLGAERENAISLYKKFGFEFDNQAMWKDLK